MRDRLPELVPYPFSEIARQQPPDPDDVPALLAWLLDDCEALAGLLGAVTAHANPDAEHIAGGCRLLSEYLRATVAIWRWSHERPPA